MDLMVSYLARSFYSSNRRGHYHFIMHAMRDIGALKRAELGVLGSLAATETATVFDAGGGPGDACRGAVRRVATQHRTARARRGQNLIPHKLQEPEPGLACPFAFVFTRRVAVACRLQNKGARRTGLDRENEDGSDRDQSSQ